MPKEDPSGDESSPKESEIVRLFGKKFKTRDREDAADMYAILALKLPLLAHLTGQELSEREKDAIEQLRSRLLSLVIRRLKVIADDIQDAPVSKRKKPPIVIVSVKVFRDQTVPFDDKVRLAVEMLGMVNQPATGMTDLKKAVLNWAADERVQIISRLQKKEAENPGSVDQEALLFVSSLLNVIAINRDPPDDWGFAGEA